MGVFNKIFDWMFGENWASPSPSPSPEPCTCDFFQNYPSPTSHSSLHDPRFCNGCSHFIGGDCSLGYWENNCIHGTYLDGSLEIIVFKPIDCKERHSKDL